MLTGFEKRGKLQLYSVDKVSFDYEWSITQDWTDLSEDKVVHRTTGGQHAEQGRSEGVVLIIKVVTEESMRARWQWRLKWQREFDAQTQIQMHSQPSLSSRAI